MVEEKKDKDKLVTEVLKEAKFSGDQERNNYSIQRVHIKNETKHEDIGDFLVIKKIKNPGSDFQKVSQVWIPECDEKGVLSALENALKK